MRQILIVVLAVATLTACTTAKVPTVSVPPETKTVAVIPSLPHEIRIATTGSMGIGNSLDLVDASAWQLNDIVYSATAKVLSPSFHVIRATTDRELVDVQSRLDNMTQSQTGLEALVKQHTHTDEPADLYVLYCVSARSHPYNDLPYIFQDIGVSKILVPIGSFSPTAHTYLLMTILDGKTLKVISQTPILMDPNRKGWFPENAGGASYPIEVLDGFEWQDSWQGMTELQRERIQKSIKDLLISSVTYTTEQTHLAK